MRPYLLAHSMGMSRAALYARMLEPVPAETQDRSLRRWNGEPWDAPVAYLTGTKEFMGLPFAVTPAVLVPRPETELLVEWALAWLAQHPERRTIVEVGTGSGAIAVSLAASSPHVHLFASDISREGIAIAIGNAQTHHVTNQIHFVRGDLLTWLGHCVDLILANLPYLTAEQADSPELAAEPRIALAGGHGDGFGLYRALLMQAAGRLASEVRWRSRSIRHRQRLRAVSAPRLSRMR